MYVYMYVSIYLLDIGGGDGGSRIHRGGEVDGATDTDTDTDTDTVEGGDLVCC